jgi:hypothetical protein
MLFWASITFPHQECHNYEEIPTSIGQLSALQKNYLNSCSSLQELPTSIGQLSALESLHL